MTAALRPRYSIAEYLRIESMSRDVKHEYVSGAIFAMAGGSIEHAALASALNHLLFTHLRGGPCRPFGSDLGIRIEGADVLTYADLSVVCEPIERDTDAPQHVRNPRVVVEVLSPRTELYDREQKRLYYQALASLREYVLIAQDRRRVEVWARTGDGWSHTIHDAGGRAPLPSLDYTLDVDALYDTAGVDVR
jgi:Uma2 family endonuclease